MHITVCVGKTVGCGSLLALLPLIQSLQSNGHQVTCVTQDSYAAEKVFSESSVEYVGYAVGIESQTPPQAEGELFFQYLMTQGFDNDATVSMLVRNFSTLFGLLQTQLVVTFSCPAAVIAAHAKGLACVPVGSSVALPSSSALQDANSHGSVLKTISLALKKLEVSPVEDLAALFSENAMPIGFPEFDCYNRWQPLKHYGVCSDVLVRSEASKPFVLGLLDAGYAVFRNIMNHLRTQKAADLVVSVEQVSDAAAQAMQRDARRLHARSANTAHPFSGAELTSCSAFLCHGDEYHCATMLRLGVPLILLPLTVEQTVFARTLVSKQLAFVLPAQADLSAFEAMLTFAMKPNPVRDNAQKFAERYAYHDQTRQLDQLVASIEEVATAHRRL
jgi:hypothetical protein